MTVNDLITQLQALVNADPAVGEATIHAMRDTDRDDIAEVWDLTLYDQSNDHGNAYGYAHGIDDPMFVVLTTDL
jgi:hypothetical protein